MKSLTLLATFPSLVLSTLLANYESTYDIHTLSLFDTLSLDVINSEMKEDNYGAALAAYRTGRSTGLESLEDMAKYTANAISAPDTFLAFSTYYGNDDFFGHNGTVSAINGVGDFDGWEADARREGATKIGAYQVVLHRSLQYLHEGIVSCDNNDKDTGVLLWDKAWALFAGSMEGTDGSGGGRSFYALSDKRCPQFKTCQTTSGLAMTNVKILSAWNAGVAAIKSGKCFDAMLERDKIVSQVTVPLIQGTLREAFETDVDGGWVIADGLVERAEGWGFASSLLPWVAICDESKAKLIHDNLYINEEPYVKDGFRAVKNALETTYKCLGISCDDVGEMTTCGGGKNEVCNGMNRCVDVPGEDEDGVDGDEPNDGDESHSALLYTGWLLFASTSILAGYFAIRGKTPQGGRKSLGGKEANANNEAL